MLLYKTALKLNAAKRLEMISNIGVAMAGGDEAKKLIKKLIKASEG